eukprot:259009_1
MIGFLFLFLKQCVSYRKKELTTFMSETLKTWDGGKALARSKAGQYPAQIGWFFVFVVPRGDCAETWSKEVNDLDLSRESDGAVGAWRDKYEIGYSALQRLLSKYKLREDGGHEPRILSIKLGMRMMASAAINRIIEAWQCQVAFMPFPWYSD